MSTDELPALLAATALGDRAAFERLYRATSAKLFGVALRILKREDWAEEALQDAYVNAWNRASSYTPGLSAPMTWMTSIVRNRCLDWLRRPHAEVADEDGALIEATAADDPDPLELLEQSTEAQAVARCLKTLDGNQRQAVMLAYFEGLSHAELASHLRAPLGSVKTWVRRGLLRLKSCLAPS